MLFFRGTLLALMELPTEAASGGNTPTLPLSEKSTHTDNARLPPRGNAHAPPAAVASRHGRPPAAVQVARVTHTNRESTPCFRGRPLFSIGNSSYLPSPNSAAGTSQLACRRRLSLPPLYLSASSAQAGRSQERGAVFDRDRTEVVLCLLEGGGARRRGGEGVRQAAHMERFPDRIREVKGGSQQQPTDQSSGSHVDQSRASPVGSAAGQNSAAAGQVRTLLRSKKRASSLIVDVS